MEFVEEVLQRFLKDPRGPGITLPQILDDPPPELETALRQQLSRVEDELVTSTMEEAEFRFFHEHTSRGGDEWQARIWILADALASEIPARRLHELQEFPPSLVSHPALLDAKCDEEGLFPLDIFEPHYGHLRRNGYVFTLTPPVQSCNSSYWLCRALGSLGPWDSTRVRLDPFLHGPVSEFPVMEYKMWWWGTQLSWDELRRRSGDAFGAWWPGRLTRGVHHTQYAWSERGDEAYLELEELQLSNAIRERGSRYIHAVYDRSRGLVSHLDGAIRIFNDEEWDERNGKHLRESGKIGHRLKLFRIDGTVATHEFSTLCASYFMWNYDVARFFGADVHPNL